MLYVSTIKDLKGFTNNVSVDKRFDFRLSFSRERALVLILLMSSKSTLIWKYILCTELKNILSISNEKYYHWYWKTFFHL